MRFLYSAVGKHECSSAVLCLRSERSPLKGTNGKSLVPCQHTLSGYEAPLIPLTWPTKPETGATFRLISDLLPVSVG